MIKLAVFYGAPGKIRTPDLLIRSQTLYPAELRVRRGDICSKRFTPMQIENEFFLNFLAHSIFGR